MTLADIQFTQRGNALVGHVNGELDMSNAEGLGGAVIEQMSQDAAGVVLDLSEVEYLDSAGIYVLFGLRKNLQARGHALILVIPEGSPVNDALRLAGVTGHTGVATTLEEALRGMAAATAEEG
jgi:anti-sigma B factor antagonist